MATVEDLSIVLIIVPLNQGKVVSVEKAARIEDVVRGTGKVAIAQVLNRHYQDDAASKEAIRAFQRKMIKCRRVDKVVISDHADDELKEFLKLAREHKLMG